MILRSRENPLPSPHEPPPPLAWVLGAAAVLIVATLGAVLYLVLSGVMLGGAPLP